MPDGGEGGSTDVFRVQGQRTRRVEGRVRAEGKEVTQREKDIQGEVNSCVRGDCTRSDQRGNQRERALDEVKAQHETRGEAEAARALPERRRWGAWPSLG